MDKFKSKLYFILLGSSLSEERKLNSYLRNHLDCFDIGPTYARITNAQYGVAELAQEGYEMSKHITEN